VKTTKKQIYEKCLIVLICLLVFGNLAHRAVLCFGPDKCASIGLRSEDCSDDCLCVPFQPVPNSCGQCDTPIYTYTEKTTRVAKQSDSTFSTPTIIAHTDTFNYSAYSAISNTFDSAFYFTPLQTVILLI